MSLSALTNENNKLKKTICTLANTHVAPVEAALASVELTEPLDLPAIQGLTVQQKGELMLAMTGALGTIAGKVASRNVEANLTEAGYVDVVAAITDIPNQASGYNIEYMQKTFGAAVGLITLIEQLMNDDEWILLTVNKVLAAKNEIKSAAIDVIEV